MHWVLPPDHTGSPGLYVLVVLAAFVLTGVDKGGFGGIGSLAIPMLMLVMPSRLALGMWLPLLVLCDVLTMRWYRRQWQVRPILLMAPWTLAGIVVGWLLLDVLDARALKVCVGALSVGFVVLDLARVRLARYLQMAGADRPWRPGWLSAIPFGLGAGVSTTIAHAAGAFTTIFFLLQRMDRRTYVGTAARFYFVFNSVKVPFFVQAGLINRESLAASAWLVPLAPLTIWAGSALNRRLAPEAFVKVIYALLVVTGAYLVYVNV